MIARQGIKVRASSKTRRDKLTGYTLQSTVEIKPYDDQYGVKDSIASL